MYIFLRTIFLIIYLFIFIFPTYVEGSSDPILRKGVNLSHWLQYWGRQPVTLIELKAIRQQGFDHVRLPFDPAHYGWDPALAGDPKLKLDPLQQAIEMILQANLTVILDVHPTEDMMLRIEQEENTQKSFIALWKVLAAHFSMIPITQLVFELLNEPQYYKTPPEVYHRLMTDTLLAIQPFSPNRTVVINSVHGANIDGLDALEGLVGDHLIHAFHYYEPMFFTHLNAPWEPFSKNVSAMVEGISYPAYLTNLHSLRLHPGANLFTVIQAVRRYTSDAWDAPQIRREIDIAQSWEKRQGGRLLCTEFGTLHIATDEDSQARWLKDMRKILEKLNIGWTVWDYADAFGIADAIHPVTIEKDGARVPQETPPKPRIFRKKALTALGMQE